MNFARRLIRTLVVDDEPIARTVLSEGIQSVAPEVEIVGHAENGMQAVDQIQKLQPELVFLDVQMPGMDGFDVVRQLDVTLCPYIVFLTAYDQHAIRAFEAGAVDYLLKPVREERLARCLSHVCQLRRRTISTIESRLRGDASQPPGIPARRKVIGRIGQEYFPIDLSNVLAFRAERELVWIITRNQRYLAAQNLRSLETKLAGWNFARVHRSTLVNLDRVTKMVEMSSHRWLLTVDGRHEFIVSKRQVKAVQEAWDW